MFVKSMNLPSLCSDTGVKKYSIWPEWTEAEIAAEKFELGGGKGKDKGKASQSLTVNTIQMHRYCNHTYTPT